MQLEEDIVDFDINVFVDKMNSNESGRMMLIGRLAISKDNIRMIDTQENRGLNPQT